VNKIVIIHFAPIELYPPAQNLLHELSKKTLPIYFITTSSPAGPRTFALRSSNTRILRFGRSDQKMHALSRYLNYIFFYTRSLLFLLSTRPSKVLYFETLSSFPAYLYKKYFKKDAEIYIHYHEYTSPEEYKHGMTLGTYFHSLEHNLYSNSKWVSHTNAFRMEKFMHDVLPATPLHTFILPNYPPREWERPAKEKSTNPLRIVYVGALSIHTMYIVEFSSWVTNQNGEVIWDIYSYNCDVDTKRYLSALQSPWISLKNGVDYSDLPSILATYSVGVVLYKGHIPNYVFNAPNKLFEYLACGLDVWIPDVMTGSLVYCNHNIYPKIMAVDFTALNNFKAASAITKTGHRLVQTSYFADDALRELVDKLIGND
jgi:hypothetical protein